MTAVTIPELFFNACERFNKPNAVLVKEKGAFEPRSHALFRKRVVNFARGLISLGLLQGEHCALLGETRWDWAVADLGILCTGAADVPVYPTLSTMQLGWILTNADAMGVVVSDKTQATKIDQIRNRLPLARIFIIMDDTPVPGWKTMAEVEQLGVQSNTGADLEQRLAAIKGEHLLTLIYTSGTTGNPKGVMLTHNNMLANIHASLEIAPFTQDDTCLAHLPLSHVLERMGGYYLSISAGITIAYAEDMSTVADNMLEVRPTIMFSVPRLYEKIFAKVHANARSAGLIKRTVFNWAMAIARRNAANLNAGIPLTGLNAKKWELADKMVFSKVKEKTGGNLRFMLSGGAPLAVEISHAFIGMGMTIVEGYGLTESSPVLAMNLPDKNMPGTVGPPLSNIEIKIAEDKEILARGPSIMQGYYKNEEATAVTIIDGWLHTGDIGEITEGGFLRITDRKKDLIITSNGKNVAPAPLENTLKLSPFIEQAVIIGDNRQFISALIVPPWETISDWAPAQNWSTIPGELAKNNEFLEFMAGEIILMMKGFGHFEQVKQWRIIEDEFSVEGGQLTPSLKVRRRVVSDRYKDAIEAMYR